MINNEQLNNIIKSCEMAGHTIKIKDISYVLLCRQYDDIAVAYKVLYNNDATSSDIVTFYNSSSIAFLRNYMDSNYKQTDSTIQKPKRKKSKDEDITFEENKAYMLKLKKDTEEAMARGDIDFKDGTTLLKDITTKLNDKFNIADTSRDQMVVVNIKYNSICEYCNHEIYIPTKEDLMKEYNLIDRDSNG